MIYADNSATSYPKPERIYDNTITFYRENGANPGRSQNKYSIRSAAGIERTRELAARLFHVKNPDRIAFTLNATDSLNMAIKSVLEEGDEAICSVLDHNSVSRPLNHLARDNGIKVHRLEIEDGIISLSGLKKALNKRTKLVVINHVSNVCGWIMPLAEYISIIKEQSDALVLIDAAQSAGLVDINITELGIDMLAFTGHKALYGFMGVGGLYVRDGLQVKPLRVGGSGSSSELEYHPTEMPERLEAGTENLPGIYSLGEGISFINETGLDNIYNKDRMLGEKLADGLSSIDRVKVYGADKNENRLAIISVNIEGLSPAETSGILDSEYGISVRSGLHCAPYIHKYLNTLPSGTVRFSLSYFNTIDEIESITRAVAEIAENI